MADRLDQLAAQWGDQIPGLDVEVMATVGRLLHVGRLIERRLDAFAASAGVDRGQGDVLFTLRRAGAPFRLTPTQLAASLFVATGTMTHRTDKLEARGLVRRVPDPADRRSLAIELTPRARKLVDRAIHVHVANEQEMLEPLSPRERAALDRMTRKLLAHLEALGPSSGPRGR